MRKQLNLLLIIMILILAFSLSSCRSDGPSGVDITGLWSGEVEKAGDWTEGPVVFEITNGGGFKMGDVHDEIIYDEAIQQSFTWSLDENYLLITAWGGFYFAEFAYDLSDDGEELMLVLIRRNFFNETYDEFDCGDRIILNLDEDNDFSYYFSDEYIDESYNY